MKLENILAAIPQDLDQELFLDLKKADGIRIQRIVSKGQSSPEDGWYDQAESEWVMVVEGAAVLSFEDGSTRSLSRGDFIDIPAHCKHRVAWTSPDVPTVWLAVFYA